MAVSVPSEPKVYTTKYDNFRGVDFTNDPSNVWSHRSPNSVNMMPDLAGRPWKRTGWEIVMDAQDFRDCYNDTTGNSYADEIIPIKTNYFQLGGEDYIAISNNLGLFFYSKFGAEEASLIYIDGFYGEVGTPTENTKTAISIEPNLNRGFYFEGNGTAGFYVFCTTETSGSPSVIETRLFRFDGSVLRLVKPYVPTIMIAKEAGDSAGTIYEHPNILTLERICQFMGNGTADFYLPEKADTGARWLVEELTNGDWVALENTTHYDVSTVKQNGVEVTMITFKAGSIPAVSTIDNVRVTYTVYGSDIQNQTKSFAAKYIGKVQETTQTRTQTYKNGKLVSTSPWKNSSTKKKDDKVAKWVIPNLVIKNKKPSISVYAKTDSSTWDSTKVADSKVSASYKAYTSELQVDITNVTGMYYTTSYNYGSVSTISKKTVGNTTTHSQTRVVTSTKEYPVKITATVNKYSSSPILTAFSDCSRMMVFGDGTINSVFATGSSVDDYTSRVWWSAKLDPSYFPDTNYIEAGSNDMKNAGLMKVGDYLGIIKQGIRYNSTVYLAYQTKTATGTITNGNSAETVYEDTYAIKSAIGGIGAVSNGAFNILNDEPLFLSSDGVMGINPANEKDKQLRNRSFFVNKRLTQEPNLETAFSFVWRNMYILAVNDHCYVLDGSQKTSWANEKTNLQYECYFWDNCPVHCFARYNEELWFTDKKGRLCRFKPYGETESYHDDYDVNIEVDDDTDKSIYPVSLVASEDSGIVPSIVSDADMALFWSQVSKTGIYTFTYSTRGYLHRTHFGYRFGNTGYNNIDTPPRTGGIETYFNAVEGWAYNGEPVNPASWGITITGEPQTGDTITIYVGKPISASWTTVLDDDGSAHYFKTLQKKGTMVVLYPQSSSGVTVSLKKDNDAPILVGTATVRSANNEIVAPSEFYLKKKAKKYKRLQIITENDGFDETFGIDEIIKCYTIGNYSRNR